MDDADHGRRHLAFRGRSRRHAAQSEQALPSERGVCDSVDHPVSRPGTGLRDRPAAQSFLSLRGTDFGAEVSMLSYTSGKTLLKVDDVSLEYDGRPILKHVSAEIKDIVCTDHVQGQVVGFLGPSGIGKTQLFRIIAGLNQPTSGQVLVNSTLTPVKAGMVGVVAQNYPLFENRTIFSNLILAAKQIEKNS